MQGAWRWRRRWRSPLSSGLNYQQSKSRRRRSYCRLAATGPGRSLCSTRSGQSPTPKETKGKGKGKGQKGGNKAQGSSQGATLTQEQIMEAIRLLTQLALRHEDNINILRQDRAFLLSMVNALFGISQQWKQHREEGKTEAPLRIALLKCLILELKTRAQQIIESKEKAQTAAKMGWLQSSKDREPCWLPLAWDSANQVDKPVQDLGPLPHSDAMRALDTVMSGADGMIIQRFISFDATAGSGPAGSNDGVPHGGFQQGRRGAGGVQRDQHPVPLRTLLCHRGENPRGHGEAHTLGFWPFFGHCCLVM